MPRRNRLSSNLSAISRGLFYRCWSLQRRAGGYSIEIYTPQGDLRVTSSVKGVDIFVDGVQTGATTDTVLTGLPTSGRRLVTVRALGMIAGSRGGHRGDST